MRWIGLVVGLFVALVLGSILDWDGAALVALSGVGGLLLGGFSKRLSATEQRLQAQIAQLRGEVAQLRGAPPAEVQPESAAAPETAAEALPATAAPTTVAPTATAPMAAASEAAVPAIADGADTSLWLEEAPASPPPAPAKRAEADEQSLPVTTSIGASLRAWIQGGNTIVRVAVLILFIGVAFLLRYAAERTTLPIEWRLAGVALAGLALTALGLRLTAKRRGYGLSLQGAGIGIVYLALFAAYRLYALVPAGLTFALLAVVAASGAVLAVRQNALALAVLGFGGGFAAPILVSTGAGNHVALFGYYLLLNLAIAWIAHRQAWKLLNLLGFLFTFGVGTVWGLQAYTPEHFASTEPFLVAFFLLYLFIAVQYTRQLIEGPQPAGRALPAVDGGLLFGVPIVAFGLQAAMVKDMPYALALSAAALSSIYLAVGRWLWRKAGARMLLLVEGLLALGVIFLVLVTPLALDARWTGAAWAVQGAGVVWIGLRQRRWWAAAIGLLLQFGAALSFWGVSVRAADALPFANAAFLGALLLALAALVTARLLQRLPGSAPPPSIAGAAPLLQALMVGAGTVQAWAGGWLELQALNTPALDDPWLAAVLSAALMLLFELAQRPLRWPALRWAARALMLAALLISLSGVLDHAGSPPSLWQRYTGGWGLFEALLLIGLGCWLGLRIDRDRSDGNPADGLRPLEKLLLAWYAMLQGGLLLYVLGAVHVARHLGWTPAAAILLPTLLALVLGSRAAGRRWPVGPHAAAVVNGLLRPWLLLLLGWVLLVNLASDGSMSPLPYLPLLNPLDLAHGLVLLFALRLVRLTAWPTGVRRPLLIAQGLLAFWWLNGVLVRSLHHWAGTPMWLDGALDSALVQTSLTVLWTVSALVTMLLATRRAPPTLARPLWMLGAGLLAVVVAKLFLVDLSNVGTLPRIVSFLVVGGLMLVIGYVSPMPPGAVAKGAK